MAAPMILVQQALSALVGSPDVFSQPSQNQCADGNSTVPALPAKPTNLPTFVASMVSVSAMRDWLKLILIGGFFELCRRTAMQAYTAVYNWFFITAVFMEDDASYSWIMVWLSQQPSWVNARDVQISTRSFGLKSNAVLIPGEEEDDPSAKVSGDRPLSYIPSYASSHSFWYKRRWCRVSRLQKDGGNWYKTKEEYLELCILSWDHRALNELLLEAKRAYKAAQEDAISIYVSDPSHGWRHVTTRPKRPLSSIVLDPGIKDLLIEDARDFMGSKNWYAVRGIPFRRGYLLYGAPGSGKTSIIHSLAGELGLDIYIVSLSRSGLDDNGLNEIISELPEKCIALMEDIDAAFTSSLNRDSPDNSKDGSKPPQQQQEKSGNRITLSGLLNALDGVSAQEGRLLFATTNKYNSLDPALTRPGRMDLHIEFKLSSRYQAKELYRCFYLPDSELEAEAADQDNGEKGEENSEKKESAEKDSLLLNLETASDASEETTVPSSPTSPAKKLLPLINIDDPEPELEPTATLSPDALKTTTTATTTTPEVEVPVTSLFHRHTTPGKCPKLTKSEVDQLATVFSETLTEREFSMASLQGYLMTYKTRPVEAVRDFEGWIQKQRKEKKQREESRQAEAREEEERKKKEAAAAGAVTEATTSTVVVGAVAAVVTST